MNIITAGSKYVDIDVLACCVAYHELYPKTTRIHLTPPYNATIPTQYTHLNIVNRTRPEEDNSYILMDISDPNHVENFVNIDKVIAVFDHHFGFEDYWPKDIAKIEPIGACATLIFEEYTQQNTTVSNLSQHLLYTAIMANTLNFKARVTTNRDIEAANILKAHLDKDFAKNYYDSVSQYILSNPHHALTNDTKKVNYKEKTFFIAQIEVFSAENFLFLSQIMETLYEGKSWLLNLISIQESCNYIAGDADLIQDLNFMNLSALNDGFYRSQDLWLRKEILKQF